MPNTLLGCSHFDSIHPIQCSANIAWCYYCNSTLEFKYRTYYPNEKYSSFVLVPLILSSGAHFLTRPTVYPIQTALATSNYYYYQLPCLFLHIIRQYIIFIIFQECIHYLRLTRTGPIYASRPIVPFYHWDISC